MFDLRQLQLQINHSLEVKNLPSLCVSLWELKLAKYCISPKGNVIYSLKLFNKWWSNSCKRHLRSPFRVNIMVHEWKIISQNWSFSSAEVNIVPRTRSSNQILGLVWFFVTKSLKQIFIHESNQLNFYKFEKNFESLKRSLRAHSSISLCPPSFVACWVLFRIASRQLRPIL